MKIVFYDMVFGKILRNFIEILINFILLLKIRKI